MSFWDIRIWDTWAVPSFKQMTIRFYPFNHSSINKQLIKLDPSTKLSLPVITNKYSIVNRNKNKKPKRLNQPNKFKTLNRYIKNFKS